MLENLLKEAFDPYFNAPVEVWKHLADSGQVVHYRKNQVIKESNEVEKYGYFLIEGSCGLFVWKENNYVCLDIFLENSFFADEISFNTGKPTPVEITALEKSMVFRISKTDNRTIKTNSDGKPAFYDRS